MRAKKKTKKLRERAMMVMAEEGRWKGGESDRRPKVHVLIETSGGLSGVGWIRRGGPGRCRTQLALYH